MPTGHNPGEVLVERVGDHEEVSWGDIDPLQLRYRGPLGKAGIGPVETPPPACGSWTTLVRLATSSAGIHVHFVAQDEVLTATHRKDGAELWKEDVFEVFLWPDESVPAYFEYELSPLGTELPLMVINTGATFHGWAPWPHDEATRVRKTVEVRRAGVVAEATSGAAIDEWRAEITIPFSLLRPVGHEGPRPGARWRANFYRIDYDGALPRVWSWCPTVRNFHEPARFGSLVFA